MYVSDLSASFSLSVESVRQSEKTAVIRMNMGGRDVRPSTLSIAEDIRSDTPSPLCWGERRMRACVRYGDAMDVISASANEINNNPPHVPSDSHDESATNEAEGNNITSNDDRESDDTSLALSSEAPDAKDDSQELQAEKNPQEPSSSIPHPLMNLHTTPQSTSVAIGSTENSDGKVEGQGIARESDAVVDSLQVCMS